MTTRIVAAPTVTTRRASMTRPAIIMRRRLGPISFAACSTFLGVCFFSFTARDLAGRAACGASATMGCWLATGGSAARGSLAAAESPGRGWLGAACPASWASTAASRSVATSSIRQPSGRTTASLRTSDTLLAEASGVPLTSAAPGILSHLPSVSGDSGLSMLWGFTTCSALAANLFLAGRPVLPLCFCLALPSRPAAGWPAFAAPDRCDEFPGWSAAPSCAGAAPVRAPPARQPACASADLPAASGALPELRPGLHRLGLRLAHAAAVPGCALPRSYGDPPVRSARGRARTAHYRAAHDHGPFKPERKM